MRRTIISRLPTGARFMRVICCIELGYPWITRGAILALEEILKPEFSVLELGSGGSTIFFANRCKKVKSYDFSQEWVDKVKNKMGDRNGVEFVCGGFDHILKELVKETDEGYDVGMIDIGEDSFLRLTLAEACMPKIKKRGYLVVDNYASEGINKLATTGWRVCTFDEIINRAGVPRVWGGTRILIKQ